MCMVGLSGRHGVSDGRHGGSVVVRLTVVLQSNPASPQPTADCQSSGGLPPEMALGLRLTSVRGDRGEDIKKRNVQTKEVWIFQ